MAENLLRDKSFAFSLRIIKLNRYLLEECREYTLAKQVLRSGTSIGANVEEAVHAQSRSDFIHNLSIAQNEASETNYWLRLFKEAGILREKQAESLLADCVGLQRLLAASVKTAKRNSNKTR